MTGLEAHSLCYVVMALAQMASAQLASALLEAQDEAQKGP